jgi:hypothetical protein
VKHDKHIDCCWPSPALLLLISGPVGTHNQVFVLSKTFTCFEMEPLLQREEGSDYYWSPPLLGGGGDSSGTHSRVEVTNVMQEWKKYAWIYVTNINKPESKCVAETPVYGIGSHRVRKASQWKLLYHASHMGTFHRKFDVIFTPGSESMQWGRCRKIENIFVCFSYKAVSI